MIYVLWIIGLPARFSNTWGKPVQLDDKDEDLFQVSFIRARLLFREWMCDKHKVVAFFEWNEGNKLPHLLGTNTLQTFADLIFEKPC